MRAWIAFVVVALSMASVAEAQTTGEKAADWISTGLVGVNMTAEAIHDFHSGCKLKYVLKNGLSIGAAEVLKRAVHEERPDGSDNKSWPSEHSWLSAMNSGWSYKVGFSIALGAGAGRVVARKHNPWDVASGLLIGALIDHYVPCRD